MRLFGLLFFIPLLIIGLIWLLLQLSPVQIFIAQKAVQKISKKTEAKISLDKIAIRFFDNVQLEKLYVEDLNRDTLLYLDLLRVDINLFKLFGKEAKLDQVLLQNAVLKLKQDNEDSTFNFQYLIDAFSSDKPTEKTEEAGEWQFAVGKVNLNNVKADIDLKPSGFNLKGHIGNLSVTADKLDFNKQEISLNEILLHNTSIFMELAEQDGSSASDTDTSEAIYMIPDIGWTFKANRIDFKDNTVALDDESKPIKPKGFDPLHFKLTGISLEIDDALFGRNTVKGDIINLAVADKSGIQINDLRSAVLIDTAGISAKNLFLKTNKSKLEADLQMLFPNMQSLSNLDNQVRLIAMFSKTEVAGSDVAYFVTSADSFLQTIGNVRLDGEIKGSINDLKGQQVLLSLNENNRAKLNFTVKGLPEIDTTFFDLNMESVSVTPKMITKLSGASLPKEVQQFGEINISGNYKGTIRDMNFDGKIATKLGKLNTNLTAKFNDDYTYASYSGDIDLEKFQLGTMLNDTSIGSLTVVASVNGSGLKMEDIKAELQATVKEAGYRNYTYHDLNISGTLDGKKFNGNADIDDPNLKLAFNGLVNLNDTLPVFQFEANLDTVNLRELHLTPNSIGIGAKIEVDFKGLNLDNFNGYAAITDINLSTDTAHIFMDSIKAVAKVLESGKKEVELTSPVVYGKLSGDYNIADLPRLMVNYVNDYFPIELTVDTMDVPPRLAVELGPKRVVADQQFDLLLTISDPLEIVQMFVPNLSKLDTAYIMGKFDSREKLLELNAMIPEIEYGNIKIDSIRLDALGGADDLKINLLVDTINYNDKVKLPLAIESILKDDKMNLSLMIDGDSLSRLEMKGLMTRAQNESFRLALQNALVLNGVSWSIPEDNHFDYRPGYYSVHNLILKHNQQALKINSRTEKKGAPIDINFSNFDLNELSSLVKYDSLVLDGMINGIVTIDDTSGNFALTTDMGISDIQVNKHPVGDLDLAAGWKGEAIDIDLQLKGQDNHLTIAGSVAPETNTLDLKMDMKRLNLVVADPFLSDFIKNSKGYLSAGFDIKGEMSAPEITGYLAFHDVSTKIVPANSRFTFPDKNRINVSSGKFELNQFELLDQENRTAIINGSVSHKQFSQLNLNLSLKTDEFLFLNTTPKENELFYGKVVMAIDAKVKGDPTLPVVDGSATAKPGTQVFINPMSGEASVEQADFIVFQSPPFDNDSTTDATVKKQDYKVDITGVDMNLLFELTPEAEVHIVIDPTTGDRLVCKGSADLVVDISPAGGTQITGSYIVESGSYSFSYQGFLKRQFEVQKDSRIDFSGDPLSANLDVTATNTVEATTYELIAAQSASLSESDISSAQKRTTVNVILKIGGKISQPELNFDIRIPSQNNPATNIAARQLSQIRQNPTELNKQVFGLLLFQSFIAEEGSSPDLAATGQNVALKSVSKLITNQLNKLASRAKGFEINFDVDSYKSKYETEEGNDMVTEVQLDVSKSFLNDRLEVTVGGNLNVENSTNSNNGGISNVTGDFVVEYKLTESGRYRVKVFQTTDYDLLDESDLYRTGVGVTYKESFRQLIKRNKKQKTKGKREED